MQDLDKTQIKRSDDLRAQNRHRILRTLRREGPISRAKVNQLTGLSQAALSTLLGLMANEGIVTSVSDQKKNNKRGRPQTTVALESAAGIAITVSISLNNITVCTINYAGETIAHKETTVESSLLDLKQLKKLVINSIQDAKKEFPKLPLKAISVGFQGVTDSQAGELLWSPILSIDRVPIAKILKRKFNVPVSVNNDCGLIASALHHSQNKKLGDSFAAILFSHGIGMGVYLSGKPFNGAHSSALELGHILFEKNGALCRCGKKGCIEAYAADYGILRNATDATNESIPAGRVSDSQFTQLVNAACENQPKAVEAFHIAGRAIGAGLATVFALLDPIPVALVGHNAAAVNLMENEIHTSLESAGRSANNNWPKLVHCYHNDTQLLLEGLALDAMAMIDSAFAANSETTQEAPSVA